MDERGGVGRGEGGKVGGGERGERGGGGERGKGVKGGVRGNPKPRTWLEEENL